MTEKLEYSAADMASAAAGGWRDGQRAAAEEAQSALAVERDAFETQWTYRSRDDEGNPGAKPLRSLLDSERYRGSAVNGSWVWFQHGAAWQRTQAAGAPDGWMLVPVEPTDLMLRACADHAGLWDCGAYKAMLAAAPAQPAVQAEENYSTTSDRYRAELYDEVWQRARDMGYSNVTMALEDLAAFRANAPAKPEVQRLREALRITRDTIDRQLEVIASRAPGNYLDKLPVVSSLKAHRARCDAALAASTEQEVSREP